MKSLVILKILKYIATSVKCKVPMAREGKSAKQKFSKNKIVYSISNAYKNYNSTSEG